MFHHYYVGHFDPRDPVDTRARPYQPKISRLIPRADFERFLAAFSENIGEFVFWCDEGYVLCNWSYAPSELREVVQRFAFEFADREDAIVINEVFYVLHPLPALKAFQDAWDAKHAKNPIP